MRIKIKKKVGRSEFEFEVDEQKGREALAQAGFLASTPDKCSLCQSDNVNLAANKAEGYTFVKVICKECDARAQMGEYKDGGYFWKGFEEYKPKEK